MRSRRKHTRTSLDIEISFFLHLFYFPLRFRVVIMRAYFKACNSGFFLCDNRAWVWPCPMLCFAAPPLCRPTWQGYVLQSQLTLTLSSAPQGKRTPVKCLWCTGASQLANRLDRRAKRNYPKCFFDVSNLVIPSSNLLGPCVPTDIPPFPLIPMVAQHCFMHRTYGNEHVRLAVFQSFTVWGLCTRQVLHNTLSVRRRTVLTASVSYPGGTLCNLRTLQKLRSFAAAADGR